MFTAGLGIVAALAFILGLLALGVWLLKRYAPGAATSRGRLPVEIVQRLPLGPKSGLAVVRVGEKVLAISVGEGGVHTLFEVDEADRQRIVAGSELPVPQMSSAEAQAVMARVAGGGWRNPFRGAFTRPTPARVTVPGARFEPFAQSLSQALDAEAPVAEPVRPASPATAASTAASGALQRHPDLAAVLSMTLAPATRLLSLALVAGVGFLGGTRALHAQDPVAPPPVAPIPTLQLPVAQPPVAQPPVAASRRWHSRWWHSRRWHGRRSRDRRPRSQQPRRQAPHPPAPPRWTRPPAPPREPSPPWCRSSTSGSATGRTAELRLNGTVGVVLMMGLLSLVPTLILMMTGFTRILIVLHFLKQAMGTQSAPPAHLVAALALLLTGFVMAPTLTEANRTAITPWLEGRMEQTEMLKVGVLPFREFMLRQTNEKDLRTFVEMSRIEQPDTPDDVPLHVLMSAFVASELRTAFQIGFAIYLPFIVIDAVVASVLMAMGMFMLPPAMISLPFKLLLFVLVDGWSLTIQSLVQSFR